MNWYKSCRLEFSLKTKDNKEFRYVYVNFELKRHWYWFTNDNKIIEDKLKKCIQEWFLIWVNQAWIFEGENPNRLIDDKKLNLTNSHINTWWNLEYQPEIKEGKIRNIAITHLIK